MLLKLIIISNGCFLLRSIWWVFNNNTNVSNAWHLRDANVLLNVLLVSRRLTRLQIMFNVLKYRKPWWNDHTISIFGNRNETAPKSHFRQFINDQYCIGLSKRHSIVLFVHVWGRCLYTIRKCLSNAVISNTWMYPIDKPTAHMMRGIVYVFWQLQSYIIITMRVHLQYWFYSHAHY